jgi:hypothetical protein
MTDTIHVAGSMLASTRSELPALVQAGIRGLVLTEPVDVLLDFPESSYALHLIRDATGWGLHVEWTLGAASDDVQHLGHLFPPSSWANEDGAAAVREWRRSYSFGQCFFRIGPSFVAIKDVRPHVGGARMLIADQDADMFLALVAGVRGGSEESAAVAVADLCDAGLCAVGSEGFLVLPYRLRRWPVPFSAI